MNYYEHHLGDYATAVQYHTWDQDMAYTRMIRWYYAKEKPLPADPEEVCRLIGAQTELQQQAVTVILRDFFKLEDDGYHNQKCDAVIAAFHAGQPEREQKKKNEDTRVERHRRERSELFAVLNAAGEHMPWNVSMGDLRAAVLRIKSAGPATAPETDSVTGSVSGGQNSVSGGVTGDGQQTGGFPSENDALGKPATRPVTAPATPATATHTPVPNNQSPLVLTQAPPAGGGAQPSAKHAQLQALIDGIEGKGARKAPACPHEKVLKLWATLLPALPQHTTWTDTRRRHLQSRWREAFAAAEKTVDKKWKSEDDGLRFFAQTFRWCSQSQFLMGNAPPTPPRTKPFILELAWLIKPENFAQVIEGKYH